MDEAVVAVADSAAVLVVSVVVLVDSAVDAVVLAAVVDSEEAEVALVVVVVADFAADEELHAVVEVVAVLGAEAHQPKKSPWNHIVTKESSSHAAKTMISY